MEAIWILENAPIPVSFDTKDFRFYKGGQGIPGDPTEAYLRLIAVNQEEKIEIGSISDLRSRVVITTPEEALEFVRLFTSIATHYLFLDSQYLEAVEAKNGPGKGEFSQEYRERMNLKPIRVKQEGDVFLIERNLVNKTGRLFRATERITSKGDYALLKAAVIDENSPIIYPLYQ